MIKKIATWIFHLAWPLGIVFIVNNLFFKLDTLMLFVIKGAQPVGIYSVAFKILEVTAFIGSFFASALKPTFAESIENNKEHLSSVVKKSISVMVFVSLPVAIICAVFAKEIIIFISSPEFVSGGSALILLGFTLPFIYLVMLLSEILIANDSRKTLIGISVFILLFNFLANLYFIPRFSFMGAAFTTLLSEVILFGIYFYYARKIINYRVDWIIISKCILIGTITLVLGFLLKTLNVYFLLPLVITIGIYVLLAWAMKLISIRTVKELI